MSSERKVLEGTQGQQRGEAASTKVDGAPATWVEVLPESVRCKAFAWRAGVGLTLAVAVWTLQYTNGVLDRVWVGLVPLAIGCAFGYRAYRKNTIRRYATVRVKLTRRERFNRAIKWWFWSAVLVGVIWWIKIEEAQFSEHWWYTWPAIALFLVGIGLYLLKRDDVLSPEAVKVKPHFDALDQQARTERKLQRSEPADKFFKAADTLFKSPFGRYPIATLCLCGAYYLGMVSTEKNSGWYAAGLVVLAGIFARELARWLLVLAIGGGVVWVGLAGISTLPVSVAIIIGALIIASAIRK
ncbi:hypothetical protein P0D88_26525 [Paraburkholderia sp. RL18-103-BIB-C]|uniref:hypothetical protein n=1 Tax=Paraburkholderia sp. RL18-103-BIB-C TaxID=3031637 RepID=UPI0038BCB7DD